MVREQLNRRGFIKTIAAAVGAVVAFPFVARAARPRWNAPAGKAFVCPKITNDFLTEGQIHLYAGRDVMYGHGIVHEYKRSPVEDGLIVFDDKTHP